MLRNTFKTLFSPGGVNYKFVTTTLYHGSESFIYTCIILEVVSILCIIYNTSDDVDFVSVNREVQFESGQLRLCVAVLILDDEILERTEDLLVIAETVPQNGFVIEGLSIAPAITDICITDDDSKSPTDANFTLLATKAYILSYKTTKHI